ncbi:hypothetical protein [Haloparvum sp. AD34]
MNREELEERLTAEFDCSRSAARAVSGKALKLEEKVASETESWDGLEVEPDYIVDRLDAAPDNLDMTGKWNWWAGSMGYFGESRSDYRIE